jgi:hypothetical protein
LIQYLARRVQNLVEKFIIVIVVYRDLIL